MASHSCSYVCVCRYAHAHVWTILDMFAVGTHEERYEMSGNSCPENLFGVWRVDGDGSISFDFRRTEAQVMGGEEEEESSRARDVPFAYRSRDKSDLSVFRALPPSAMISRDEEVDGRRESSIHPSIRLFMYPFTLRPMVTLWIFKSWT